MHQNPLCFGSEHFTSLQFEKAQQILYFLVSVLGFQLEEKSAALSENFMEHSVFYSIPTVASLHSLC